MKENWKKILVDEEEIIYGSVIHPIVKKNIKIDFIINE